MTLVSESFLKNLKCFWSHLFYEIKHKASKHVISFSKKFKESDKIIELYTLSYRYRFPKNDFPLSLKLYIKMFDLIEHFLVPFKVIWGSNQLVQKHLILILKQGGSLLLGKSSSDNIVLFVSEISKTSC